MEKIERANKRLKTAKDKHERDLAAKLNALNKKEGILKKRLEKLNQEKVKISDEHGDLDADGEDLVEINAGGRVIAAKRSTLTQLNGTRLEALFSGRWDKKLQRDSNGRIFLDVNPICFQAIVDYLNELTISSENNPPKPPHVDEEFQHILFSQLELFGLVNRIFPVDLPDSDIVKSSIHASLLHDWLEEGGSDGGLNLLYRSSIDGLNAATFHAKCDNKGPTLTIIETADSSILGGYTDASWSSDDAYISSNKAFLFVLSGMGNVSPIRMKMKQHVTYSGILCHPMVGPAFGYEHGPLDLYVSGSTVITNFGSAYEVSSSGKLFIGSFIIKEMEVFQVCSRTPVQPTSSHRTETKIKTSQKITCFTSNVNEAMNNKLESLHEFEAELSSLEKGIDDEKTFTSFFSAGGTDDLINLNVSGSTMVVDRETLMLHDESILALKAAEPKKQQADEKTKPMKEWTPNEVVSWMKDLKSVPPSVVSVFKKNKISGHELLALGKDGMIDLGVTRKPSIYVILDEIKKVESANSNPEILIDQSPYCVEKVIDHLRHERYHKNGLVKTEPLRQIVRDSEKERFEKVVKHYFPETSSKFFL
ncbi:hypothetical protein ACHAXS_008384 [Conticribra weissflogii]